MVDVYYWTSLALTTSICTQTAQKAILGFVKILTFLVEFFYFSKIVPNCFQGVPMHSPVGVLRGVPVHSRSPAAQKRCFQWV